MVRRSRSPAEDQILRPHESDPEAHPSLSLRIASLESTAGGGGVSLADAAPPAVSLAVSQVGTSSQAAREDHTHQMPAGSLTTIGAVRLASAIIDPSRAISAGQRSVRSEHLQAVTGPAIIGRVAGTGDREPMTKPQVLSILGISGVSAAPDNAVLRGDGAGGIQSGPVTIDDTGAVAGVVGLTMTGTLSADTIAEATAAAGVTIDGVLLKDGGATASGKVEITTDTTVDSALKINSAVGTGRQVLAEMSAQDLSLLGIAYSGTGIGSVPPNTFYFRMGGASQRPFAITTYDYFVRITFDNAAMTLGAGYAFTLSGGVIADSTGTIKLDDNTTVNGTLTATSNAELAAPISCQSVTGTGRQLLAQFSSTNLDALMVAYSGTGVGSVPPNMFYFRVGGAAARNIAFTTFDGEPKLTIPTGFGSVALGSGVDLTLNGGVIADSTGTITLDDNTQVNGNATVTGTLTVDAIGASAGAVAFTNNIILNGVSISDSVGAVSVNDDLSVFGVVKASLNATVAMRVSRPATASGVAYAFELRNTAGTSLDYADIACLPTDATAGSEDGSLLFRLRENGIAPATKLTLNNTGATLSSGLDLTISGGRLLVPFGGASAPAIAFLGDQDTGIDQSIGNAVDIITGGTIGATVGNGYASFNGYMSVSDYYEVDGFQVVGPREPAIANPAGGATVDTEARAAIGSMLSAMRSHGLIYS